MKYVRINIGDALDVNVSHLSRLGDGCNSISTPPQVLD